MLRQKIRASGTRVANFDNLFFENKEIERKKEKMLVKI